jgi:putative permease
MASILYIHFRPLLTALILFLLGLLLAVALHPPLTWLQEHVPLPRGILAGLLVLLLLGAVSALLYWVVPILLVQALQLVEQLPLLYEDLHRGLSGFARRNPEVANYILRQIDGPQTQAFVAELVAKLGSYGFALGGSLLAALLVLVVAFYSLVYPMPLVSGLLLFWPSSERARVAHSITNSLHRVRTWLFGLAIMMLAVGVATAGVLWLLGVPYALLFGLLAMLLEVVPTIGPILAAVPPVIVAFLQEPVRALWVTLAFIIIQQLENHLLLPGVMGGALRVHPVLIVFGLLVLGTLFGILGLFLAVPLMAIGQAVVQEFYHPAREEKETATEQARTALEMQNLRDRHP